MTTAGRHRARRRRAARSADPDVDRRPPPEPAPAARARQLRAPPGRLRRAGRRASCVACPDVRILATSREPLGIAGEAVLPVPSLTVPAADPGAAGPRRPARLRRGAALPRAGPGGQPRLPADGRQWRRGRPDLPAAGRHPAGHRAGRGPPAGALGRADRGPPGRPVPAADRRQPRGDAAPADAPGGDRLELRAADRRRSGAAPAPLGLRRRPRPRGRRGGRRGRSGRRRTTSSTSSRGWSTSRW